MMTALIGVNTSLLKRGFELSNSTKFMIQTNSLLKDIVLLLDSKASFIKDEATLFALTHTNWSIKEKKASLSIDIDISSNSKTFNVNRVKEVNSTDTKSLYGIMEDVLLAHNVIDSKYFLNILLDSIDTDLDERVYESEIALLDSDFEQGLILSMNHFDKILSFYKLKVQDYNIDKVPWDKIIGFGGDSIDINYMSADLLAYILPMEKEALIMLLNDNRPITSLEAVFSLEDKETLDALSVKTFVPSIKCFVNIDVLERTAKANFIYNLNTKRASDVNIFTRY